MKIVIKQANIVDPQSPHNGQQMDILIVNGTIEKIAPDIPVEDAQTVAAAGLYVSPGWIDIFSDFADPGYEHRESILTGLAAAAKGGYTDVCVVPNTKPVVDQKSVVEYVKQKAANAAVNLHPLGAISLQHEGKELAEMYDMKLSGAVAFTDGWRSLQSSGTLVKALQYVKSFNGVVIQVPDDTSIQPGGLMNEGITSTRMGLLGRPAIAEAIAVTKNIQLANYAASKLHLTGISTQQSLELITANKTIQDGVTCSVTPYHLFFSDEDLTDYDTNLKVSPALRTPADRTALQQGIEQGPVDCIASHHAPHHTDNKIVEFEYARNGMIGLQTAYAVINTTLPQVSQQKWIELLAINPRKILGLEVPVIREQAKACITLFQPGATWTFEEKAIVSKSKNSPFIGKSFTGKPLGIINNNQLIISA